MDRIGLRAGVEECFDPAAAGTPPWPDPHPDREVDDEDYFRCTDPGRYRILRTRLRAWVRALSELDLATATGDDPALELRFRRELDRSAGRAFALRPRRQGALPLLAHLEPLEDAPEAVLTLATGAAAGPLVLVESQPDCGCDACDSGSADLLDALDRAVLDVVTGRFVHLRTAYGPAWGTPQRWHGQGWFPDTLDVSGLLAAVADGGTHPAAVHGLPW